MYIAREKMYKFSDDRRKQNKIYWMEKSFERKNSMKAIWMELNNNNNNNKQAAEEEEPMKTKNFVRTHPNSCHKQK